MYGKYILSLNINKHFFSPFIESNANFSFILTILKMVNTIYSYLMKKKNLNIKCLCVYLYFQKSSGPD